MPKKADFQATIKEACVNNGTYKPEYDAVIKQLADVLELRQGAIELYKKEGSKAATQFKNREGETYFKANPLLKTITDLDKDALSYWRDLGLTPAAYKKLSQKSDEAEKGRRRINEILEKIKD